ncbi:MAG TPA: hypothetical protein VHN74_13735 [Candidatus Angelobacter sp.]|jgi:hypothetical protein|nr:hypothetical protein [Candidatus Angelobacter sp.]
MRRREFLSGLTTLPIAGSLTAFASTKDRDDDDKRRGSTLSVFLHGPFAVILNREKSRLTAYVPFAGKELQGPADAHEFVFQRLQKPLATENVRQSFQFSPADHFPGSPELPYIDHGFDDFTVRTPNWKRDPANYFVMLDLPLPDVITYIPPAEGVQFVNGTTGIMPIQHILEYKVRDWKTARLRSNQKVPENELRPIPCAELYNEFREEMGSAGNKSALPPRHTQRTEVENYLARCARLNTGAFFFGVGLHRAGSEPEFERIAKDHALRFFNKVLLPSVGDSPDVKNKALADIGEYGPMCIPPRGGTAQPTAFQAIPHLRMVSSSYDCRLGGLIGTGP